MEDAKNGPVGSGEARTEARTAKREAAAAAASAVPTPKMTRTTLEVLEVLTSGDDELYGLKIAQATGMKTGTVYPILNRLERAGWVESEWESPEDMDDKGPRRKFFRLTTFGRERARGALETREEERARARVRRKAFGFSN